MHRFKISVIPVCCLLTVMLSFEKVIAQDDQSSNSSAAGIFNLSDRLFNSINKKSEQFQNRLNRSAEKYLDKLQRHELKLKRSLSRKDSAAARQLFGDVNKRYDSLRNVLTNPPAGLQTLYSGHLDSMYTALRFLDKTKALNSPQVKAVLENYKGAQGKLDQTDFIQKQLKDREQFLKDKLQNTALAKQFKEYQKQLYYYHARVDEYKNIFEDPRKMETTLLKIVTNIPSFKKFFDKYSQLGGLFSLPGNEDANLAGINGLQTRSMIMQQMQGASMPDIQRNVNGSIANAQSNLEQLKNKLIQSGNSGEVPGIPGFKPNNELRKSFLRRLEYGSNIQSVKSNLFFPVTTDIGVSIGYRINSRSTAGIGGSYKIGWGKDFRHIAITHQGVGLRSFVELKLKGSIWFSAGGEMNYRSAFKNFDQLKKYDSWQKSALAGVSKKYQVNKKLKGNIQLLYDFLHARQVPEGQPVVFRMGYTF